MKIYIIGSTGSGKTTLAKALSKKHNIKYYELDSVMYDDENGNIKRPEKERNEIFNGIINKKQWIVEDVGRDIFSKAREKADIIYYIDIPKIITYKRVIIRWIKQRLGIEKYNYPPTLSKLITTIKIKNLYYKNESKKLESLSKHQNKIIKLNYKELNELEK